MENQTSPLTDFDLLTFSNRLQILKTLFPYMPPASKRIMSSYIKTAELNNALRMCNNNNVSLGACSDEEKKNPIELLSDIKNFCSKKEQETIDSALNLYSTFQMYRSYMDLEKNDTSENSMFDILKNMMTPEQQTMFDTFQQNFQTAE